jgi:subtilisin family serine protease
MAEFADTSVDILNLSFGCYTDDGQPPLVLAKAVSLLSPKILLVAAAGNHGNIEQLWAAGDPLAAPWTANLTNKTPVWPAAFAQVTAVGATDGQGKPAAFSPEVPWVDVTAQGVDVESTYLDGQVSLSQPGGNQIETFYGYARWQGTSFAAATVSGAVAAKIGPGRDAHQALEALLADRRSGIQRYSTI